MGARRLACSIFFLIATVPATATAVSAGAPPGPLAFIMECSGPGPNGSAAPGQTDNCGIYLHDGVLAAGSVIRVTVTAPSFTNLACQPGVRTNNICTFTTSLSMSGHGVIGGELIDFNAPGTVTASLQCVSQGCGQAMFAVIGPGATVTQGIRPRIFPMAPYAYDVCTGPNPDGTVSETQVDTCNVYLAGGGGPFVVGDNLQIARSSPVDIATVVLCAGSSVTAAMAATTANLCDFHFTSSAQGSGMFIGQVQFYIPNTVEPQTPIGQVAFFCSAPPQGQPGFCPDVPVTIDVRGPGATVIDEIPPTFTFVPADMTVDATGPTDTVVTFPSPTAVDNAHGTVAISCSPASGAMFTVGPNAVTCTATDSSGNSSTATFNVVVQNTFDSLCGVTKADVTKEGIAHSLCVKLEGAADAFAQGDSAAVDGKLGAYVNEVDAQNGNALTAQQAQDLEGLAALLMV